MSAELVTELEARAQRTTTARVISALGPITALAGLAWAMAKALASAALPPDERKSAEKAMEDL